MNIYIGKFSYQCFLNLVYNESLCCVLRYGPEQNDEKIDFLHGNTNSLKVEKLSEKYWGGRGHKRMPTLVTGL